MENITVQNRYLETFDDRYYNYETIEPLNSARLVSVSKSASKLIGVDLTNISKEKILKLLNGEILLKGSKPYSMAYAGHQFGYYVPQLGDGRAINIGTINGWHLQLKGSGQTKYSRFGDGRAVLRSSIREYLISEAMHGLGIPTTRALAIITSDHPVFREYEREKGAMVLRLSPSWIRIGSFEYFFKNGGKESVKKLADFVIEESYPHLKNEDNIYEKFYLELVERSALMVAKWQSIGFMHGVLNTDNTSTAGLTIDYGPYAFMDRFKMNNICNHTDREGRYSYANQPYIIEWNLGVLAETLKDLADIDKLKEINRMFYHMFKKYYYEIMREKLGLYRYDGTKLIDDLLMMLESGEVDYTSFFHTLSGYQNENEIIDLSVDKRRIKEWLDQYNSALLNENLSKVDRQKKMKKINPKYVLKNYMIGEAIKKADDDDFSLVDKLLEIAHDPFNDHDQFDDYSKSTPKNCSNLKLSCSS
jgi:uncharacterized protein YdiU (UPF0061 family)